MSYVKHRRSTSERLEKYLPNELWLKVFQRSSMMDLQSFPLVCKRWQDILLSPYSRTLLNFDFIQLLRQCTSMAGKFVLAAEHGHLPVVKHFLNNITRTHYLRLSQLDMNMALHKSVQRGFILMADFLLERGAHINYALSGAALGGHLNLLKRFLDEGADDLDVALVSAAKKGHLEVVQFLVEQGAEDLSSGFKYAADYRQLPVMQFFYDRGIDGLCQMETFIRAVESGHGDVVDFFLRQESLYISRHTCEYALMRAIELREADIAKSLVDHNIRNYI
jgi:ankyrin repeat protein